MLLDRTTDYFESITACINNYIEILTRSSSVTEQLKFMINAILKS